MTPQSAIEFRCPRWSELPAIDLYMDQVVLLLERALKTLDGDDEPVITATMVNNYVKKKLIPAPVKKKYGREQIAALVIVTVLKRALSMPEIARVLSETEREYGVEGAYDRFCDALEKLLSAAYSAKIVEVRPLGTGARAMLDAALTAWIGKMLLRDQCGGSDSR